MGSEQAGQLTEQYDPVLDILNEKVNAIYLDFNKWTTPQHWIKLKAMGSKDLFTDGWNPV